MQTLPLPRGEGREDGDAAHRSKSLFHAVFVKRGVAGIEIACIHALLHHSHCLAEPLEVDNLPLPQIADGIDDIRIIRKTQDVIIGRTSLLLGCKILGEVGKRIALGLEIGHGKWHTGCRKRIDRSRVIDKILVESSLLEIRLGKSPCELVHDRGDHFHVGEFFSAYIRCYIAPLSDLSVAIHKRDFFVYSLILHGIYGILILILEKHRQSYKKMI